MSITPPALPSSYEWGMVVGQVIHAIGDTSDDADRLPQATAATGSVTFTPATRLRTVSGPPAAFVAHEPVICQLGPDGELLDADGQVGVWLITGVYSVSFALDDGASITGFQIEVLATHTDLAPLDLAAVAPYIPPEGATVYTLVVPSGLADQDVLVKSGTQIIGVPLTEFAAGGGVTDHGALTGLGDDDHTQYALADGSRGNFAATNHNHTAAQISDSTATGQAVVTAADAAAARSAIGAAPATQTVNAQTGTSYTLQASDAGKLVTCTNASAITLTVPSSTFTAGQRVDVLVRGAGMVTVVGSGVTLNPESGLTLVSRAQFSAFTILFISSTVADVTGSMAAA